jgi:hypothetical protein
MKKIYIYKNIEDINKKSVIKSLNKNDFVIIRGLFDPSNSSKYKKGF